jgi:hypothetical protein
LTPIWFEDGSESYLEYTGFPVFDEEQSRGVIMFLIGNAPKKFKRIRLVRHSSEWEWIEMRNA